MGETTGIEWTHHTFNPWLGCSKVSPACTHCYAETNRAVLAAQARTGKRLWGRDAARVVTSDDYWRQPIRWDKEARKEGAPRRVFCASLADVFEPREDLEEPRRRLWGLITATPMLDWLLLTKRPANVVTMIPPSWLGAFPRNVWVGTTIEDQERAELRILDLLRVPARIRFLSCEPLLGPVDVEHWLGGRLEGTGIRRGISWVIAGGETRQGDSYEVPGKDLVLNAARVMHPAWARSLRDQCARAGVPFFFKQWGNWRPPTRPPAPPADKTKVAGGEVLVWGRGHGGTALDGRDWKDFPA